MRKLLALAFAVVVCCSSAALAFQTVGSVRTFTAQATTSGGSVSMSVALSSGSVLSFGTVAAGTTKWKAAENYLVLHSTITDATGGIQIYTDNTNASAPARFTGTGTANPAGLVDGSSTTLTLPMCWRVVDVSTGSLTINQGAWANNASGVLTWYPDRLWANELTAGYPCFVWMKDLNTKTISGTSTVAFSNGEDYVTVKNASGIQHAEGSRAKTPSPDYVYIGADFSNAMGSRTYQARICVEAFTE